MSQKHSVVVKGIKCEIAEYLKCVKTENNFKWGWLLRILLMLVEIYRNKIDEEALKEWAEEENRQFIIHELNDIRGGMEDSYDSEDDEPDNSYKMERGYSIDKTRKRREYERNR